MSKSNWNLLKVAPTTLGVALLSSQSVFAAPATELSNSLVFPETETLLAQATPEVVSKDEALSILQRRNEAKRFNVSSNSSMSQVTSVSELRDVEPTAWAYEALRSLVERYGCIVGYPDRTFRGDRALTRWEFAAGLNACMNVMERLIQENASVFQEDIDKLKRLAEEFQTELAALGARVDNLESRTSYLEDHQFSTTTKLSATAILAITDASGAFALDSREQDQFDQGLRGRGTLAAADQAALSNRVRLNFDTSFTGTDRLRTRLSAGNVPNYNSTGTDMARLGWDLNTDQGVIIEDLWYRFRLAGFTGFVGTAGLDLDDVFDVANPYLESSDTGALSRFSRRNPLTLRGPEGAGGALKYTFGGFYVAGTYLADEGDAGDPSEGAGLFNGSFSAGAQVGFKTDTLNINAVYLHSYFSGSPNYTGSTGSRLLGVNPFANTGGIVNSTRGSRDSYGIQASWQVLDFVNLAGWGGYALATAQDITQEGTGNRVGADYWTWNAAISFLDVFKEGAVLNLNGGLLPRAARVDQIAVGDFVAQDQNASYIIEASYGYPISKNILLTPGAYVILNPDHNNNNPSIWVGVLRTTFKF